MMNFKKTLLTLVFVVVSLNIFGPLVQTVSAADIEDPETRMASLTERWVRYRALYFCFNNGKTLNDYSLSYDEMKSADFMGGETVGIGYLNEEDGKVSCDDGAFVNNSASKIGWDGVEKMVCSMEKVTCSDGGYKFDTGSTSKTAGIFKTAKGKIADSADFPFDPKGEMWYYLYKRNLEVFCGDKKPITSESSSTSYESKKAVSAHYVDPKTGEITRVNYDLNRDDTDTINDIYAGEGDGTIDRSCSEIAEKTRNHSAAYASYIRKFYIDSVAQSIKDNASFSDALRKKICGDKPTGDGEVVSNAEKIYKSCISNQVVGAFNNAVDTCAAAVPSGTLPEKITDIIKACLKTELPDEFDEVINAIGYSTFSDAASAATSDDSTSCAVDGIGWIICPVFTFLASITDAAYSAIDTMLTVQPITTGPDGPYEGWSIMRNLANVAFVLAFLFIIYSQITGAGLTNYGVKKMLPKLIVAAILVNTSYWICAIAVDASNILGSSFKSLFDNMNTQLYQPGDQTGDGTWNKIAAGVLATSVLLYLTLSVLGPMLVIAAFAIVTVVLVLTLRQALIILLIVISPLAFVAYLLPNTEQWFKKWLSLLQTLLLMFPIIAVIFGASAVAGTIITNSAANVSNEASRIILQIMGAGVTIIPLAITPIIMKTAGGVLNRFGGFVNNPNKGPFDRMRKRTEAYRDKRQDIAKSRRLKGTSMFGNPGSKLRSSDSRLARGAGRVLGAPVGVSSGLAGRKLTKDRQAASAKAAAEYAEQNYVATRAADESSGYAQKIAGPTGSAHLARAYAIQSLKEEQEKDVKAAQVLLKKSAESKSADEYKGSLEQTIHGSGDTQDKIAAMREYATVSNAKSVGEMAEKMAALGSDSTVKQEDKAQIQRAFAETFGSDSRMPASVSGTNKAQMQTGNFTATLAERIASDIDGGYGQPGKINGDYIAKMDVDEMKDWVNEFSNPEKVKALSADGKQSVVKAINDAANDAIIGKKFGPREIENLQKIATSMGGSLAVADKSGQTGAGGPGSFSMP